jgi:predicted metal-dependent hydrolase
MDAHGNTNNYVELETRRGRRIKVLAREHPRARRMSLTMSVDGPRLSTPRGTPSSAVKAFLKENADWLESKLREMERAGVRLAPPVPGVPDTLTWRGDLLLVRWEYGVFPHVKIDGTTVTIALDLDHPDVDAIARRAMRSFFVAQMKREVARLARLYEPVVGRPVRSTRLLPMKTLWGSLSAQGRMTLDLSLMLAPVEALEYVVVHEMCHLWIRNHGRRFWERVEAAYPQYHDTRVWLSRHGHAVKAELSRWIGTDLP